MAKRRKKKAMSTWKAQVLLIVGMITAVMFSAMAVIMVVGMIPTIVAGVVDRTKGKVRTLTVGSMNFAGCAPFMIEMFKHGNGNNMSAAISYILEPRTIVVMYFAAGMGYLVDWAMTGIVSSIMVQKAKKQIKDIQKQQKDLIDRWGPEVTNTIPLDEYGFPRDAHAAKIANE